MNYNKEWYDAYSKQLDENQVRYVHEKMFQKFYSMGYFIDRELHIIDLGCATCEFYKYGCCEKYFGIDLFENEYQNKQNILLGDYTKINLTEVCPFKPNAFISLFSTELYLQPYEEKYQFYEKIFQENPSIEAGMVAGFFYYDNRMLQNPIIEESAGWPVYQTTELQFQFINDVFDEVRVYNKVPSKMFGPNLVEVWKFLFRKN